MWEREKDQVTLGRPIGSSKPGMLDSLGGGGSILKTNPLK